MRPDSRIYVAGHRGLVGSAIVRRLQAAGHSQLLLRQMRQPQTLQLRCNYSSNTSMKKSALGRFFCIHRF